MIQMGAVRGQGKISHFLKNVFLEKIFGGLFKVVKIKRTINERERKTHYFVI